MKCRLLFAGFVCWFIGSQGSFASEAPRLSITNSQAEFIVSWPASASNWVLEASPVLPPAASWVCLMPQHYETDGALRVMRITGATGNRFYRLRRLMPSVPGLTGQWHLDEGTGQMAGEGNGSGATLFTAGTTWAGGRFGPSSLQFDGGAPGAGSSAWVSNENYRVLPGSGVPFSVSLWFNPDAVETGWRGLAGNDTSGTNGWRVALHTPGPGTNLVVFSSAGPGASLSVTGRTLLLPGQWHQLTMTHDGAEGSVYLNSALLARGAGMVQAEDGPVFFGGGIGGLASFFGRMDEVRTYTNGLTQEQVTLKGHWRFDETCGDFAADSSVWGHHAGVTVETAWVPGREGSGIDLGCGQVVIGNEEQAVLPPTGGPFSLSLWVRPGDLGEGRHGLMHCSAGAGSGWQLAVESEASGAKWLHWISTNSGGTLDLRALAPLTSGIWTKLELTYNGGIATLYADGRKLRAASGAIRSSKAALVIGAAPGATNFNGVIDDLKIYGRERGEGEVGPFAPVLWETVLRNTTTNITVPGSGPAGKPLTYSIVPDVLPTNGTVTIEAASASFTYAAGGRKGPDAFTYTVSDGEFTSPPAIVTMSVVEPHWLSPGGGPAEPRDGSSPAQAWSAGAADALDALWRTNHNYDCFFYAPGVFETRGWKYYERSTANSGCKHIGSGSEGVDKTTIRLVDILDAWGEETIFAPYYLGRTTDNFEVHNMVLDCNAINVPKYTRGEPVSIRIPLATTGPVGTVTLHWGNSGIYGNGNVYLPIGPAVEFSVCALKFDGNNFSTNCLSATHTGQLDVVTVGAVADELVVRLERRATGVDFYGLAEIEVTGAAVSLPKATVPGGGESRLDALHSILLATDDDPSTWWASGPEGQVQIALPLAAGTTISEISLSWNCKTIPGAGRAGPAADYSIQARDELTGQFQNVPFTRQFRTAGGVETAVFGADQAPIQIVTDQLVLLLTTREAGVDYYSLRGVTVRNSGVPVRLRQPSASNFLNGDYAVQKAFDRELGTLWASATQGMVGAMNVSGSNLKFTRLRITGFGTKAMRECFPMGIGPGFQADRPQLGNVLVEECVFTEPAPSNPEVLTALVVAGNSHVPLTNAVVRRCTFSGLRSHFVLSHATAAVHVENCTITDCSLGVYFEPEPGVTDGVGPLLVRSNSFIDVNSAVFIAMHPGTAFDSITMLDNEIVLAPRLGSGLGICDTCYPGPGGTLTNLTILGNVVRYADWAPRPSNREGGFGYSDIHQAVYGNNVLALGGANDLRVRSCPNGSIQTPGVPEDCDHHESVPPGPPTPLPCLDDLLPGYKRAWFNNRNLSGVLSEIRINKNGVEVPAVPQQWPD